MEEIIRFLTEYTEMFEKMEQKQVEKLGLLMTKELDKIEESIMMQQAMDKQLQNMEQRRQELFGRMELTGKTLQEVAESCGGEERKQLTDLYRRLAISIQRAIRDSASIPFPYRFTEVTGSRTAPYRWLARAWTQVV